MLDDKDEFGLGSILDAYVLAVEATKPYVPRHKTYRQLRDILVVHQLAVDTELRRLGLLLPLNGLLEVL